MNLLKKCLELLYPKTCCFCGKLSKDELCKECADKVVYIAEPRCKRCGKPIRYAEKEFCHDCAEGVFYYEQGRNIWLHKGVVRHSIYQYKYHNRRVYGEFYARELFRLYGALIEKWKIDVIIPVPLHKKRRRQRGYNQAEIIARHLSKLSGVPVNEKAVERVKHTRAMKELSDKERKQNLQNAFRATKHWKKEKNILLIDDIYTTGSTINSISEVLKKEGAEKVMFFTISIGQGF